MRGAAPLCAHGTASFVKGSDVPTLQEVYGDYRFALCSYIVACLFGSPAGPLFLGWLSGTDEIRYRVSGGGHDVLRARRTGGSHRSSALLLPSPEMGARPTPPLQNRKALNYQREDWVGEVRHQKSQECRKETISKVDATRSAEAGGQTLRSTASRRHRAFSFCT